jgi:hypothetical protein
MNVAAIEPLALSRHELFSDAECRDLSARVVALRKHWARRGYNGFFSLGTAAYLDAPESFSAYLAAASETNVILRNNFDDALETVRAFFEEMLGQPAQIAEEVAVPGFHIFEFDGSARQNDLPATRAHFDLQWVDAFPRSDLQGTVSFTVLVDQPSGGAAMQVWPLRFSQTAPPTVTVREYAQSHTSRRLAYDGGGMIIHDGHVLHAIGTSEDSKPRGRRITLQGHGALIDGTWVLYW